MSSRGDFFATLFDTEQSTCFAESRFGVSVFPVEEHEAFAQRSKLFCINALHPTRDLDPYEDYHDVNRPRRADANVICYRNILVEMDNLPLNEQADFVKTCGMPWTTAVYSGGKSIHFILSLETPLENERAYRALVARLYKALGGAKVIDAACKNPSRMSRFPDVMRDDVAVPKKQLLIKVQDRVKNEDLLTWIADRIGPEAPPAPIAKQSSGFTAPAASSYLNGFTLNFVMFGAPEGQRNLSLFRAACDFARCGYSEEDALERLTGPSGLEDVEIERTVSSAYRKIQNS